MYVLQQKNEANYVKQMEDAIRLLFYQKIKYYFLFFFIKLTL